MPLSRIAALTPVLERALMVWHIVVRDVVVRHKLVWSLLVEPHLGRRTPLGLTSTRLRAGG